ncbi:uncharacterized protein PV07_12814, partial [Cladophialophora immunda]
SPCSSVESPRGCKNLLASPSGFHPFDSHPISPYISTVMAPPMDALAISAAVFQKDATAHSTEVLEAWHELKTIVERHEGLIRKRWQKKNSQKQREILLAVMPDMPPNRRPDFAALRKDAERLMHGHLPEANRSKNEYFWPSINLADLLEGNTLPLYINSRGRHEPSLFSVLDYEASRVGRRSSAIPVPTLEEYIMLLDGRTVDTYGRVVALKDASTIPSTERVFTPGAGLIVLQTQKGIYSFLNKCCKRILHDMDPLAGGEVVAPPPLDPSITGPGDLLSWGALRRQAPFGVPTKPDLKRLSILITAKYEAIEDHIWALREDPSYLEETITDWTEHQVEQVLDLEGKSMLDPCNPTDRQMLRKKACAEIVRCAYIDLVSWHGTLQLLTDLAALMGQQDMVIREPTAYLQMLQFSLRAISQRKIRMLKSGVPASPELRHGFCRHQMKDNQWHIGWKYPKEQLYDHLIFLFRNMWNDKDSEVLGLSNLIDELDRLIDTDPKQKNRLSRWSLEVLSDLGLAVQVEHELDHDLHFMHAIHSDLGLSRQKTREEFRRRFPTFELLDKFEEDAVPPMQDNPHFDYPSDRRRTAPRVEKMRKAERELDLFWQRIDKHFADKAGKVPHEAFRECFRGLRSIQRTPEWIEVSKVDKSMESGDSHSISSGPSLPWDTNDLRQQLPKGELPKQSKKKEKTRKAASNSAQHLPEVGEADPRDLPAVARITVSPKAFKIFSTLFPLPGQSDSSHEFRWQNFRQAMGEAGFQSEKLYGSVWLFTSTKPSLERPISIHDLHSTSKIPIRVARYWARRLGRVYGWHNGTFQVK